MTRSKTAHDNQQDPEQGPESEAPIALMAGDSVEVHTEQPSTSSQNISKDEVTTIMQNAMQDMANMTQTLISDAVQNVMQNIKTQTQADSENFIASAVRNAMQDIKSQLQISTASTSPIQNINDPSQINRGNVMTNEVYNPMQGINDPSQINHGSTMTAAAQNQIQGINDTSQISSENMINAVQGINYSSLISHDNIITDEVQTQIHVINYPSQINHEDIRNNAVQHQMQGINCISEVNHGNMMTNTVQNQMQGINETSQINQENVMTTTVQNQMQGINHPSQINHGSMMTNTGQNQTQGINDPSQINHGNTVTNRVHNRMQSINDPSQIHYRNVMASPAQESMQSINGSNRINGPIMASPTLNSMHRINNSQTHINSTNLELDEVFQPQNNIEAPTSDNYVTNRSGMTHSSPSNRYSHQEYQNMGSPRHYGVTRDPQRSRHPRYHHETNHIKLPPFTGKERWKIWLNRFMEVARLRQWSDEQKLMELLPKLQGPAGEFVFDQLNSSTRRSFSELIEELNNRFRVVETTKTFRTLFTNRDQAYGESAETYAAELKRLYDKAYPERDRDTRSEDLLRRFLGGLYDDATRFHIEYVKEPDNIDVAVYEAINFYETKRRHPRKENTEAKTRRPARMLRQIAWSDTDQMVAPSDEDSEDEDDEQERVARTQPKKRSPPILRRPAEKTTTPAEDVAKTKEAPKKSEVSFQESSEIKETLEKINGRLDKIENHIFTPPRGNYRRYNNSGNRGNNSRNGNNRSSNEQSRYRGGSCYNCGQENHWARDCPYPISAGQMQGSVQPGTQPQPYVRSYGNTNYQTTEGQSPTQPGQSSPENPQLN